MRRLSNSDNWCSQNIQTDQTRKTNQTKQTGQTRKTGQTRQTFQPILKAFAHFELQPFMSRTSAMKESENCELTPVTPTQYLLML